MSELKSGLSEVEWTEHFKKCERSKKSMALYCRENNLIYESMRLRKAERPKVKRLSPVHSPPAFVNAESMPAAINRQNEKKKTYPHPLADPDWLVRFIFTYVNSIRSDPFHRLRQFIFIELRSTYANSLPA